MTNGSHAEVQLENEHFRVTRWTVEPGGLIPMHEHQHEYVVVPMVTDTVHVVSGDGEEIAAELVAGRSYSRAAGTVHQLENRGHVNTVVFVEVEKL